MSKQTWLWGAIVLLLVVSLPGIVHRWNAERLNNNVEMIIPYDEIAETAKNSGQSVDEVLSTLKKSGLTTVSFQPVTLTDLEKQNALSVYKENELADALRFTAYNRDIDIQKTGYYLTVPADTNLQKLLTSTMPVEKVQVAGEAFYFLPSANGQYDMETPIGYDQTAISQVAKQDLKQVFKIENNTNENINDQIVQQLVAMKTPTALGLLGSGDEAFGFGQPKQDEWIAQLHKAGYYFYTIESNSLKGEYAVAKKTNYEIVRLLSINVNKETDLTLPDSIDRAVRAAKERNIKSMFYHIKLSGNATDNLKDATDFLANTQNRMPSNFVIGAPKLFEKIVVPAWVTALVILAGVLFTYVVSELVPIKVLRFLAAGFMALLGVAYFALDRVLFLQVFALIIACITPIYATLKVAKGSSRIRDIFVQYIAAVAISAIGIWIVIGLLNGNGFVTGFEVFRGVKLVYVIPILGLLIYAFLEVNQLKNQHPKAALTSTVKLFNKEVKYWHIVLFVFVAAVGLFYISRTGNSGSVSNVELSFRQWLEDLLYVRPRTKEFLIGFPVFVLALYVMSMSRKWGSILLVVGVIGFLSIVNTFTHLHIPVYVSILRTTYSVVLGFVIGVVFIYIFKIAAHYFVKLKTRWS